MTTVDSVSLKDACPFDQKKMEREKKTPEGIFPPSGNVNKAKR